MNSYEDTDICVLINKCRQHDDEAFEELVRRYTPMIKKVISGFIEDQYRFSEIFNEACFALHSAMRTFDVGQNDVTFGLYAKTCVHNRIVDMLRAERTVVKAVDVDVEDVTVGGPEVALMQRERFEQLLKRSADLLSDYEYKVLMLHIQGHSTAVIAKTLGRTAKSVDNAKSRLFSRLRSALSSALDN